MTSAWVSALGSQNFNMFKASHDYKMCYRLSWSRIEILPQSSHHPLKAQALTTYRLLKCLGVRTLWAKSEDLNPIPGTYMVKGKNWLLFLLTSTGIHSESSPWGFHCNMLSVPESIYILGNVTESMNHGRRHSGIQNSSKQRKPLSWNCIEIKQATNPFLFVCFVFCFFC